jgi:hypothetical protein
MATIELCFIQHYDFKADFKAFQFYSYISFSWWIKNQKQMRAYFDDFRRWSMDFLKVAISNDDDESQHMRILTKKNIETHHK